MRQIGPTAIGAALALALAMSCSHDSSSDAGTDADAADQAGADAASPKTIEHRVTFYGWPDVGLSYPKLHSGASGTGTYADPITFASDPGEWAPETILYLPYLERYVIMEDWCADCVLDWKDGKRHIAVWVDSDGRRDSQVLACENALTREQTAVEVAPPPDRPVDTMPLFDSGSGNCHSP